jgi:hypothetical protein
LILARMVLPLAHQRSAMRAYLLLEQLAVAAERRRAATQELRRPHQQQPLVQRLPEVLAHQR